MKLVANSQALAPTRSRVKWDAPQSEVCKTTKTLKHKLQLAQFSVCKTRTPPPAIPNPMHTLPCQGNGPQRSMASLPNQAQTDSPRSGRNATSRQSPIKRGLPRHIATVPSQAWTDWPLRDSPQPSADCLAT
ncbi:hypothetical protein ACLB2K_040585 [Fragaria x ananassa]